MCCFLELRRHPGVLANNAPIQVFDGNSIPLETLVECERVIIRARALEEITEKRAQDCRSRLIEASNHWYVPRVSAEVVERARLPFPHEPVRTLDALHLASALIGRNAITDLAVLSLDERIRSAAKELGFKILPK